MSADDLFLRMGEPSRLSFLIGIEEITSLSYTKPPSTSLVLNIPMLFHLSILAICTSAIS